MRRIDRREAYPHIVEMMMLTLRPATEVRVLVDDVWKTFKAERGQEHWRCACALAEKEQ